MPLVVLLLLIAITGLSTLVGGVLAITTICDKSWEGTVRTKMLKGYVHITIIAFPMFALFMTWGLAASRHPYSETATLSTPISTVVQEDGTSIQCATDRNGNTINVTNIFHCFAAPGSNLKIINKSNWVCGVYFPEDTTQYRILKSGEK